MPRQGLDATAIIGSDATTSDKIRALSAAGYARADIARLLGKRYQHVRNVLEDDKARDAGPVPAPAPAPGQAQPSGMAEAPGEFQHEVEERSHGYYRFVLGPDGTLRLPQGLRDAMGVDGKVVMGQLVGDELTLISARTAMRQIQDIVRKYVDPGVSLADELIAERRAEAARELREWEGE